MHLSFKLFCSVAQLCLTLSDRSGLQHASFPVLYQLLEPAQTHVHWVGEAIQPSRPLSSPSPPAFSLSQHLSFPVSWLFTCGQSVGASASVSVLPMDVQGWFPLGLTVLISSQESSPAPHFYSISCLVLSHLYDPNSHPYMTTEKPFSSVQSLSHVRFFVTPWTAARQASLSITSSQSLLKLLSLELEM